MAEAIQYMAIRNLKARDTGPDVKAVPEALNVCITLKLGQPNSLLW